MAARGTDWTLSVVGELLGTLTASGHQGPPAQAAENPLESGREAPSSPADLLSPLLTKVIAVSCWRRSAYRSHLQHPRQGREGRTWSREAVT